jgi:hypothetical protein
MKNLKFLIIALITSINVQAQKNEQIAFDYFFNDIFPAEYKDDICKISFSGFSENELTSFGIYKPCFEEELSKALNAKSHESKQSTPVPINREKVEGVKFKKGKSKYRLNILKASKVGDFYYVQIELTKKNHFTNAYFLQISDKEVVTEWCKTGLVW